MVIEVPETRSILETHMIGEKVKEAVLENIKEISGMSVNCFPVKKTIFGTY